ncbi:MAG: pilus assembly protein PilV, partial [Chitinophagaceae bacterium]|nr:pilus assembly protein PilV [Rubrivivax sp.]
MTTAPRRMSPRGIALIEALVALAVMAFGLLSVAGLQVVLRQNADNAKQRSEAVRLAQEEIEELRAYSSLTGPVGTVAYNNLVDVPRLELDTDDSNTTFYLTRTVSDSPIPAYKTLTVDVDWLDRVGATQNVRLSTAVLGVEPALAATV